MKNKKAFEVQFNWIFVLVAGAAILILVSFIIFKQKNIFEASIDSIALRSIESIVAGTSVSSETSSVITVPDLSIQIDCGKISIGKISKQYPRMVLFSPSLIKGSKIIAQTLSFSAPYKSSNLLFMTSTQARYILVGSSSLMKSINKSLPSEMNKEVLLSYNPSLIKNSNNYKVQLIFDNLASTPVLPPLLSNMPAGDLSALNILGDLNKGTIEFYENNGNSFVKKATSSYLGKTALIAAVYADDKEHYECNMKNVFAKHEIVSEVYYNRINNFITNPIYNPLISSDCKTVYSDSVDFLSGIKGESGNLASSISESNRNNLANAADSLKTQNKDAQKYSCPTIY